MSGYFLMGKERLLQRTIPETYTAWICGVNTDYAFNENQVEFELIEEYIILEEKALTSVTYTDGVLDADNPQWIAAGAGASPEANIIVSGVLIYFTDGDERVMLAFIDGPAVGLPLTLKGVNVTAKFDDTGILKL